MNDFKFELLTDANEEVTGQLSRLVQQLTPGSPTITPDHIRHVLANNNTRVITALDKSGKIVGMATVVLILKIQGEKKALIEDVVVDETVRGMGLGKKLVVSALEAAKQAGVKTVFLTSRPSRVAANQMYKSLGFEQYETNNYKKDICD